MALGNNLIKQIKETDDESNSNNDEVVIDSFNEIQEEDEESLVDAVEDNKNLQQYCVFRTNQEEYAIPIELVQEVVKFSNPTPVPQMPSYILGMTNIRGNVFGILDIEKFFSLDTDVNHKYLLVLDHEDFKMAIGIPEVPDSIIIDQSEIENLSSSTIKSQVGQKYLKGVIKKDKRMIIVFDIEGIVSSDKFTILS